MAQIGFSSSSNVRQHVPSNGRSDKNIDGEPHPNDVLLDRPMISRWIEMSHVMGALFMRVSSDRCPNQFVFASIKSGHSQVGDT